METNKLIEINNVKKANRALNTLLSRTKSENVGLGLFYGRPGLGKTRWAIKTAIKHDYVYFQLVKNVTLKTFLKHLLVAIKYCGHTADDIRGTAKQVYDQILDHIQSQTDCVIFIDEIDYAFENRNIIATIRDLADQSFATFVLIGMQNAKVKLRQLNSHYFDRCNAFCEFKDLTLQETDDIIKALCDVKLDPESVKTIYHKTNGTMRQINKYIDLIERIANKLDKKELSFKELKEVFVHTEN